MIARSSAGWVGTNVTMLFLSTDGKVTFVLGWEHLSPAGTEELNQIVSQLLLSRSVHDGYPWLFLTDWGCVCVFMCEMICSSKLGIKKSELG